MGAGNRQRKLCLEKDTSNQLIAQRIVNLRLTTGLYPIIPMHIKALLPAKMVFALFRNDINAITGHAIQGTVLNTLVTLFGRAVCSSCLFLPKPIGDGLQFFQPLFVTSQNFDCQLCIAFFNAFNADTDPAMNIGLINDFLQRAVLIIHKTHGRIQPA